MRDLHGDEADVIGKIAPQAYLIEPLMPPSHAAALLAMKNGINGTK